MAGPLKRITNIFRRHGDKNTVPKKLAIILVQDALGVQRDMEAIIKALNKKEKNASGVRIFEYGDKFSQNLARHRGDPKTVPDLFFLDSGGAGQKLGAEIAEWFTKHRPDSPAPSIYYLSLSTSMAIREAAHLETTHPQVKTGAVSETELHLVKAYLAGKNDKTIFAGCDTDNLRRALNERLGLDLPLDVDQDRHNALNRDYQRARQGSVFNAWRDGKMSAAEAINSWRSYVMTLTETLQTGLYKLQKRDVETDAAFYQNTGFPVKGTAVFTREAVENWPQDRKDKPVLIMQSYDPDIVPLLDSGKLGGLVVCGPYLAAHLALLCEANKVSGVFGLIPRDQGTVPAGEFNEMAKSHLAPYFSTAETEINGSVLKEGQEIILGAGRNGIVFKPENIEELRGELENDRQEPSYDDVYGYEYEGELRQLQECFRAFFKEHNIRLHNIKANADTEANPFLRLAQGIGLIRTEQIAAGSAEQSAALRRVLLDGAAESYDLLASSMKTGYRSFMYRLNENYPVKFRLFDLSPKELLDREDQKQFHERYGRMDIHGGAALETWPQLYRTQAKAVFDAYKSANPYTQQPLQIMMPAVRTEQDVTTVKTMIAEEAAKAEMPKNRYSFGVMIETLDSCGNAAEIIPHCDFISFGTNDLTQQVLDIPRDDLRARARYEDKHGYDPYKKLAPDVLEHIRDVCTVARSIKPDIEIDICGNQASDPKTALQLFDAGVDNLSVAPSQENMRALPFLLNYLLFDRHAPESRNLTAHKTKKHDIPHSK